jgi:hypothetical protein
MGYIRMFRRVRLAPNISLNVSCSGPSLSFGVRGAHLTVGRTGVRQTVGIPGTGVFYTNHDGWHSGVHSSPSVHGNEGSGGAAVAVVVVLIVVLSAVLWAAVTH